MFYKPSFYFFKPGRRYRWACDRNTTENICILWLCTQFFVVLWVFFFPIELLLQFIGMKLSHTEWTSCVFLHSTEDFIPHLLRLDKLEYATMDSHWKQFRNNACYVWCNKYSYFISVKNNNMTFYQLPSGESLRLRVCWNIVMICFSPETGSSETDQ